MVRRCPNRSGLRKNQPETCSPKFCHHDWDVQSDYFAELIQVAPAERIAIILPESGIRVSYQQLRDQVTEMADALASLGIQRGDRVATYLPNGLPTIVSFLAASIAERPRH
jgi:acyl-CoA synthetase (AMP-forming)/AMP-acid ligase II